MGYASRTRVPASQTRSEIEALLKRHGADQFSYTYEPGTVSIAFLAYGRRVRFALQVPDETKQPRQYRRRWRALYLSIKAKLTSVTCGIEEFEEAFLAQIVTPSNQTMSEVMAAQLRMARDMGLVAELPQWRVL